MKDFKYFVFFCLTFLSALVMAEDVAVALDVGDWLVNALMYVTMAVGAASLVLQGVALITGITPSQKDDLWLGRVQKVIAIVQSLLERISLGLPADKARKQ